MRRVYEEAVGAAGLALMWLMTLWFGIAVWRWMGLP